MQNWKSVWEARKMDPSPKSTLAALMKADGLDTEFAAMPEEPWRQFVADCAEKLGITSGSSVFEVGCGAGAFLHDLALAGCHVAGTDLSSAQIDHIRQAIPQGTWTVQEAIHLDPDKPCDYVIAMGVFMYFPSNDYAFEVLRRMLQKATKGIAVLDIPNAAKQTEALRFRQGALGDEEYRVRYNGLSHLYFDKQWMENSLASLGLRRWAIEDQHISGYGNAAYRFNVFGWKDDYDACASVR